MWQNRSSLPITKQSNTRLFSHYPAPSLHSLHTATLFCVSLSVFPQSLFSSPLHPTFYFAEVKLSPGVCQVSSDSLKVRGHASPGPVPVGSPISQNRLGRWDGQWEWQGGQLHGFRGEQMALGVGFFVHHCFSFFPGECAENTMAWSEWVRAPGREKASAELWMLGLNPLYLREGLTALFQPRLLKTHPAIALFNPKRK